MSLGCRTSRTRGRCVSSGAWSPSALECDLAGLVHLRSTCSKSCSGTAYRSCGYVSETADWTAARRLCRNRGADTCTASLLCAYECAAAGDTAG